MKYLFFSLLFLLNFSYSFELNLKAEYHEKMKLLIGLVDEVSSDLRIFAENLKNDLECSGQLAITISEFDKLKTKSEIKDFAKQDYIFALFLNKLSGNGISWRLYDTMQATMIKGKKLYQKNSSFSALAHKLADTLSPDLTGRESSFYTSIAACKKVNKKHTHLHVFHPTEFMNGISRSQAIVTEPTTILLSKWHPTNVKIYFSKHGKYNVKLMSINENKQKSIVANFDGINMPPTISEKGRIVIPVTIAGKGRLFEYTFDEEKQKGKFKPITHHDIHAVSPSFINEDKLVFCAIDELCKPRIAILNKDKVEYLPGLNGLCPSYSSKNNMIAYCKKEGGYYQVFTYDLNTNTSKQLTKCNTDKDGCSWSPCGSYVICSCEKKNKSRIAIFNVWTNQMRYLTHEGEDWTSPSWSPIYNEIPFYN
ncbi:MAG: hypothetical protein P4L22_01140 [Candidatus Babeliales bacterium]|nr:hypothetical protein [Candidatus Babeliales bacterium]